jgi:hypothetical protein
LAALFLVTMSCRLMDAPHSMTLSFEPDRLTRTGQRLSDGRANCDVDAAIQAHGGTAADSLVLLDIVSTFYDSTNARVNSTSATPSTWFGTNYLGHDERGTTHRVASGPARYSITISLRYLDPDEVFRADTLSVVCQ